MSSLPSFARAVLVALAVAGSTAAHALPLVTGNYAATGIGAEFASPYDNFSLNGRTLDISLAGTTPTAVALADWSFEVGPNCYSCDLRPSFDALVDISLGGVTRQLDLSYAWSSTGPIDSLTFASAAPLRFDVDGRSVTLAFADLGVLSASGGVLRGRLDGTLTVTPVPEPAPWMLIVAGFGLVGWMRRRRG